MLPCESLHQSWMGVPSWRKALRDKKRFYTNPRRLPRNGSEKYGRCVAKDERRSCVTIRPAQLGAAVPLIDGEHSDAGSREAEAAGASAVASGSGRDLHIPRLPKAVHSHERNDAILCAFRHAAVLCLHLGYPRVVWRHSVDRGPVLANRRIASGGGNGGRPLESSRSALQASRGQQLRVPSGGRGGSLCDRKHGGGDPFTRPPHLPRRCQVYPQGENLA